MTKAEKVMDSIAPLEDLASLMFCGEIFTPESAGYDEARRIHNYMHDARPKLIAKCVNTADVVAIVGLASRTGLPLAVRGGGHNVAGHSTVDAGIVLDLSRMRTVRVDPRTKTAHVAGGAQWSDFDRAAQLHGLATPGGAVSTTGVAGLTLGGGQGWLTRKFGLTLDNLIGVEIVTATGDVLMVDAESDADLFWAIRGAGANFGVVTDFHFQLHDIGPVVYGGPVLWPIERATEVLTFFRDWAPTTPEELGILALVTTIPRDSPFPQELWGQSVVGAMTCFSGPVADGPGVLAPLVTLGSPVISGVGPIPYTTVQSMFDHGGPAPAGRRQYWKTGYLTKLDDDAISAFVKATADLPSDLTTVELGVISGALNRMPEDATACGGIRAANFHMLYTGCWLDEADDESNVAHARGFHAAMSDFYDAGAYLNFLSDNEGIARVQQAFTADGWQRVVALKRRFDPDNLFRRNHNIPTD